MQKEVTSNTFDHGLIMDLNPLAARADSLTSCLNGTLLSFNGNEMSLLNDMGNGRVETAYLPEGYVPVGICQLGGIIYIASHNPLTGKSLIGSFPSPERNISSNETNDTSITINWQDFVENDIVKQFEYKTLLLNLKLNPGDLFVICYKGDNKLIEHLSSFGSEKNLDSNIKDLKLDLYIVNENGKRYRLTDKLIWHKIDDSNWFYIIPYNEDANNLDLDEYRSVMKSGFNYYPYNESGNLELDVTLECINNFLSTLSLSKKLSENDEEYHYLYFGTNWSNVRENKLINPSAFKIKVKYEDGSENNYDYAIIAPGINLLSYINWNTRNITKQANYTLNFDQEVYNGLLITINFNSNRKNDLSDPLYWIPNNSILSPFNRPKLYVNRGTATITLTPKMKYGLVPQLAKTFIVNTNELDKDITQLVGYLYKVSLDLVNIDFIFSEYNTINLDRIDFFDLYYTKINTSNCILTKNSENEFLVETKNFVKLDLLENWIYSGVTNHIQSINGNISTKIRYDNNFLKDNAYLLKIRLVYLSGIEKFFYRVLYTIPNFNNKTEIDYSTLIPEVVLKCNSQLIIGDIIKTDKISRLSDEPNDINSYFTLNYQYNKENFSIDSPYLVEVEESAEELNFDEDYLDINEEEKTITVNFLFDCNTQTGSFPFTVYNSLKSLSDIFRVTKTEDNKKFFLSLVEGQNALEKFTLFNTDGKTPNSTERLNINNVITNNYHLLVPSTDDLINYINITFNTEDTDVIGIASSKLAPNSNWGHTLSGYLILRSLPKLRPGSDPVTYDILKIFLYHNKYQCSYYARENRERYLKRTRLINPNCLDRFISINGRIKVDTNKVKIKIGDLLLKRKLNNTNYPKNLQYLLNSDTFSLVSKSYNRSELNELIDNEILIDPKLYDRPYTGLGELPLTFTNIDVDVICMYNDGDSRGIFTCNELLLDEQTNTLYYAESQNTLLQDGPTIHITISSSEYYDVILLKVPEYTNKTEYLWNF